MFQQGHPAPVPPNPRPTNLPPEANFKTVPAAPKLRVQLAQEGRGKQILLCLKYLGLFYKCIRVNV